ncbi:MAG: sulfurtransferase [Candidatus Cloacimonetes bacterium]|nr:sulfurtransferase [Candidatus Cloacimonadota bacterium]
MLVNDCNLVSSDWLLEHLNNENLVVLNGSQIKDSEKTLPRSVIKGSLHFDFSNVICDLSSGLPNTMPNADKFSKELSALGIKMTDFIVVYDDKGIYSAPRVWWMFKAMGFDKVAVLDGGLPRWLELGYPCVQQFEQKTKSNFQATYQDHLICDKNSVLESIASKSSFILDARSNSRFTGTESETRAGLRSGHIPASINLHFRSLVPKFEMLPQKDLLQVFNKIIPDLNEPITFTCGSGVTACILALAATICGYKNICVYDGSWTEWGADESLDIEVG